ncbi:MAG TPA: Ku protein [Blastocatellia bacterium]|nr:Ku protein [Blastocatellia bacterium]
MSARAIWKGKLKLGATVVPVKLYSAVQDRTVRFHILDEKHRTRVKQHMIDPVTGKEFAAGEIKKAYEIEPGKFVLLEDEELEKLEPEPSREIEIAEFVSPEKITQQWYERPYYLGPDGDQKSYFALAEALENRKRVGIAHWVMRKREYSGALSVQDAYLVLITLRSAEEVISARDLSAPAGRASTANEIKMAKQLLAALEGTFEPAAFKDEYRERVMAFIESKAKGRKPRLRAVESKRKTTSLDGALARSLKALEKEKRAA